MKSNPYSPKATSCYSPPMNSMEPKASPYSQVQIGQEGNPVLMEVIYPSIYPAIYYPSIYLSIQLSIYLSIYPAYISIYTAYISIYTAYISIYTQFIGQEGNPVLMKVIYPAIYIIFI